MTLGDLAQETDDKFIARLQNAKARAEDFDRHQRAEAGLEMGDGSNHQVLLDSAPSTAQNQKKKRDKASNHTTYWLDLIQQQIYDTQKLIEGAENNFTLQYGEDWREQFAMRILDPDLMPQSLEGESIEDYRARVEAALMDELLNDDGTIKAKYKDHPEYGELAQWAQWKHDQQLASNLQRDLNDPSLSDSERTAKVEEFTQSATYQRLNQKTLASTPSGDGIMDVKEDLEDTTLAADISVGDSGFKP